jgi:hypothetical protein
MKIRAFILSIYFGLALAAKKPDSDTQTPQLAPEQVSQEANAESKPSLRPLAASTNTTSSSHADTLSIAGWYVSYLCSSYTDYFVG